MREAKDGGLLCWMVARIDVFQISLDLEMMIRWIEMTMRSVCCWKAFSVQKFQSKELVL